MGTVAVDLDGTILEKTTFPHYGSPRDGAIEALAAIRSNGDRVIIHTCRKDEDEVRMILDHWGVVYDDVSCGKPLADMYVDNRARIALGDVPGHRFHGNQWTSVGGSGAERAANVDKFFKAKGPNEESLAKVNTELKSEGGQALTADEHKVLYNYCNSGFVEINYPMRLGTIHGAPIKAGGKKEAALAATIGAMDSALNKMPTYQGSVKRIMQIDEERLSAFFKEYAPGKTVSSNGYTSATYGELSALKNVTTRPPNITVHIQSVGGCKVPQSMEGKASESEVIFKRGTKFRVSKVVKTGKAGPGKPQDTYELHLKEVGGVELGEETGHPFRGNQYSGDSAGSSKPSKPLRVAKSWDKVHESHLYGGITRKAALIAPDGKLYSVHQAGRSALHEDLVDKDPKAFGVEVEGEHDTPADMMERAYPKGLIRVSYNPGSGATDLTLDGNVRTPDDIAQLVDEGKLPASDSLGQSMFNVEHVIGKYQMGLTVAMMRGKTSWANVVQQSPLRRFLSFDLVFGEDQGHPFRGNQYSSGDSSSRPSVRAKLKSASTFSKLKKCKLGSFSRKAALFAPNGTMYDASQLGAYTVHDDLIQVDPQAFGVSEDADEDLLDVAMRNGAMRMNSTDDLVALDFNGKVKSPDDIRELIRLKKLPNPDSLKNGFTLQWGSGTRGWAHGVTYDKLLQATKWEDLLHRSATAEFRFGEETGHPFRGNQYSGVDGSTRERRQGSSRQAKWYAANREARFQRRFGLDAKIRQAEIDEREVMRRALSLSEDKDGQWVTVGGQHIFIQNGANKDDVVKQRLTSLKQGGTDFLKQSKTARKLTKAGHKDARRANLHAANMARAAGDEDLAKFHEEQARGPKVGGLSSDAHEFILAWQQKDRKGLNLSDEVIRELSAYVPSSPVTLYRGGRADEPERDMQSWTTDPDVAQDFTLSGPNRIKFTRTFQPHEVLIDVDRLPSAYKKILSKSDEERDTTFMEEHEVVTVGKKLAERIKKIRAENLKLGDSPSHEFRGNQYRKVQSAAVAAVHKGKVLILKRGKTAPWMPSKWNLPGGTVDGDEDHVTAAVHEAHEEARVQPNKLREVHSAEHPDYDVRFYSGELPTNDVELDPENDDHAWVSREELDRYDFVPDVRDAIEKTFDRYRPVPGSLAWALGDQGEDAQEIEGHWITIHGAHIFIKEGADFHETVKDFFKKKYNNLSSWISKNKGHTASTTKKTELEEHKVSMKVYKKDPQAALKSYEEQKTGLAKETPETKPTEPVVPTEQQPASQPVSQPAATPSPVDKTPTLLEIAKLAGDPSEGGDATISDLAAMENHAQALIEDAGIDLNTDDLGLAALPKYNELKAEDPHGVGGIWETCNKNTTRYGTVLVDVAQGKVLLREPEGHYQGFHWTFSRGGAEPGEHPVDAAVRETMEETGFAAAPFKALPAFRTTANPNWSSCYYMAVAQDGGSGYTYNGQSIPGKETAHTRWATYEEAKALIEKSENVPGRERDLAVLNHVFGKTVDPKNLVPPKETTPTATPAATPAATPVAAPAPVQPTVTPSGDHWVTVNGHKILVHAGENEQSKVVDFFKKKIASNVSWLSKNKSAAETLIVFKKAEGQELKKAYQAAKSPSYKAANVPASSSTALPSVSGHMATTKQIQDFHATAHKLGVIRDQRVQEAKAVMPNTWGGDSAMKALISKEIGDRLKAAGIPEAQCHAFLGHKSSYASQYQASAQGSACTVYHQAASELIQNWACTSGDHDPTALAIQHVVGKELGLTDAADATKVHKATNKQTEINDILHKHGSLLKAFTHASYANTQELLAKHGITELTLQRGVRNKVAGANVQLCPISSFAYKGETANHFAGSKGTVMLVKIPAKDVFGSCLSGHGCLNEQELVILGGVKEVSIVKKKR